MSTPRPALALILIAWASMALIGCGQDSVQSGTTIVLPTGDPEAGRKDFASLGCALCHRASGDQGIPAPASTTEGPTLGPAQAARSDDWIIDSILNPSHRMPDSMADRTVSPMPDYSGITIRQLSDVTAYIRYLGE